MADKTFIVSHAHARAPLTISGKTLAAALKKEGLSPSLWKKVPPAAMEEVDDLGENKGDARPEDY